MSARTADSRQRTIKAAATLFQRQGYAATGVAQIIEESGSPRGSFYFNFPGGKEELAEAAMSHAGAQLTRAIEGVASATSTPEEFLHALKAGLAIGLEVSDFQHGCPIATVALETASVSEALRAIVAAQFARWQAAIASGLAAGDPVTPQHEMIAAEVLMLLEGALLMCRTHKSSAPLRSLDRTFALLLSG